MGGGGVLEAITVRITCVHMPRGHSLRNVEALQQPRLEEGAVLEEHGRLSLGEDNHQSHHHAEAMQRRLGGLLLKKQQRGDQGPKKRTKRKGET